jgi:hypothetical protein
MLSFNMDFGFGIEVNKGPCKEIQKSDSLGTIWLSNKIL